MHEFNESTSYLFEIARHAVERVIKAYPEDWLKLVDTQNKLNNVVHLLSNAEIASKECVRKDERC